MNNKKFAVILLVVFLIGVAAAHIIYHNYVLPMTGIIEEEGEVTLDIYIDGVLWIEGTPIDWGTLTIGDNLLLLSVTNTGDQPAIVTFIVNTIPEGWTLTWAQSGTELAPTTSISADMILTVPEDTIAGTYSWEVSITTSAP